MNKSEEGARESLDKFKHKIKKKYANGKGDIPRPVNVDVYRENYDRIFGKKKKK